ncbi:MAG: GatB/YqeY domain-containing protein [Candidatus Caldatribacterium sp.]|uniref:GatB/YqeY domain-containing protein n=1 Tax=Candidatus Caldatribacterium sp. TaxID=2282143 RepID=UPI00299852A1|nr:GatB/YqeY domain-containing protein [Candidatus Caldatribacterium sp.]MCX7729908.1 GatB/YqeY domain-containing protein [Candidatus Caldatribacterium sp.]MDW8081248.1 GatB/YqeY domain-containing protein [Candidatus Calescibacterium sp.]
MTHSGIKARLQEAMKEALKARDQVRLDTIRLLLAEIRNAEIEKRAPLEEHEVVALLRRGIKKREESLMYFRQAGREDLIRQAEQEMAVITEFLPPPMTEGELVSFIQETIAAFPEKPTFSVAMREIMRRLEGRAEGKLVSEIVRKLLEVG